MIDRSEPACLVIADIAGYSGYLAGVELDHAQDVIADLVDTVVGALRPTFQLAKLEGDAAFVWLATETVDGSELRDVIDGCYFAFRRRVRDIRQASVCECNACIRVPRLDLKFVAHHGRVARQRMAGMEELVGNDVIIVHRLLKNSVSDALGIPAYALFTDALVRQMDLTDPTAAGMHEHRESFESVGEIAGWVTDLGAAWDAEQRRARTKVTDEDALYVIQLPTARVPPEVLWEWVTSPVRRVRWTTGLSEVVEDTAGGRRGLGTVNHCAHGQDVSIEEIVDWVPPEYETKRITMEGRGAEPFLVTTELFARDGGETDLCYRMATPGSDDQREALLAMEGYFRAALARDGARLIELAEADARERAAGRAAEPAVPKSAARNVLQPIVFDRDRSTDVGGG